MIVRDASPDRYIATLYAPEDKRGPLFALYGFDAEISQVAERVSEPLPGEIRLQWWRDVIGGERRTEASGNPIAAAFIDTVDKYDLPRQNLANLLDARIFDLYSDPMPSRNDLEGYCGETVSAIFQLAAMVLDPSAAKGVSDCAGHAGVAYGIARLLQSLPRSRAFGQCFVPADILNAAGSNHREFVEHGKAETRVVEMMVALASEHLTSFETLACDLPKQLRPAFLPLAPVRSILTGRSLGTASYRAMAPYRQQWAILRRAVLGWK